MTIRVGIFASAMATDIGHEKNVSGHVQLPVETVGRLQRAGYEVHLITNTFGPEYVLPAGIPEETIIHLVADGRKRPKSRRGGEIPRGLRPLSLVRQLYQLRGLTRELDVLHIFGLSKAAVLAGMLGYLRPHCPIVATLVAGNLPKNPGRFTRSALRQLDAVLSPTEWAANQMRDIGIDATVIRQGMVRDLHEELQDEIRDGKVAAPERPRRRVLFWRDSTIANGADLCLKAFDRIAGDYPDFTFDMAIRPSVFGIPGLEELEAAHPNVNLFRYPYEKGISLPRLIGESCLVLLPFRRLSVDPQLAIAESLDAGVPVIATDIRSNPELIEPNETGLLIPPDNLEALVTGLRQLLDDPARLDQMGQNTRERFQTRWNWDGYIPELTAAYKTLVN